MQQFRSGPAAAPVAALATWLLPGLGHILTGHPRRGFTFLVVIGVTFWGGVAIGGVKSTIEPQERRAWFAAQICTGVHAMTVLAIAQRIPTKRPYEYSEYVAHAPAEDIAVVYTGVAGLLNVLVIFDVLSREAPTSVPVDAPRGPPPRRSG